MGCPPPYLCVLLSPLAVAGRSAARNRERRLVMFRGPSQPLLGKRNLPLDPRAKGHPRPTRSLPPKLVVTPVGCAPRPDVSSSCHWAALRVKFPIAPLASMIKFHAAVDERVLDNTSGESSLEWVVICPSLHCPIYSAGFRCNREE